MLLKPVSPRWSHHDVFELRYRSLKVVVEDCDSVMYRSGGVYWRPDWSPLDSGLPCWEVLERGRVCVFLGEHAYNLRAEEENYR